MIFTYVQTSNHEIIKSGGDQIFNQCFRFVIRINDKSSPKIRYYYGNKMPLLIIHCTSLGMVDFSRPNELFLA